MPLVHVKYVTGCKEVVIPPPGGKGTPVGGITCKQFPVGQPMPDGYSPMMKEEDTHMCNKYPDLVCASTADAIKLANPTQLLTFALAGLTTLTVNLTTLPLWHSVRLVYFATNLANPDDATVTLTISGINQVGPLLGGELSSNNANPCAIWNCAVGRVMGPNEVGSITIDSASGAAFAAGTTVTVRVAFFYNPSAQFTKDAEACESGGCGGGECAVP